MLIDLEKCKVIKKRIFANPRMKFNFVCQLDRAIECLDIWLNIILSVSVSVFLDEVNI